MYGVGLDYPLEEWFEFSIKPCSHRPNFVEKSILQEKKPGIHQKHPCWIGAHPEILTGIEKDSKNSCELLFYSHTNSERIRVDIPTAQWLVKHLRLNSPGSTQLLTNENWRTEYENATGREYESLTKSPLWKLLVTFGLLML